MLINFYSNVLTHLSLNWRGEHNVSCPTYAVMTFAHSGIIMSSIFHVLIDSQSFLNFRPAFESSMRFNYLNTFNCTINLID